MTSLLLQTILSGHLWWSGTCSHGKVLQNQHEFFSKAERAKSTDEVVQKLVTAWPTDRKGKTVLACLATCPNRVTIHGFWESLHTGNTGSPWRSSFGSMSCWRLGMMTQMPHSKHSASTDSSWPSSTTYHVPPDIAYQLQMPEDASDQMSHAVINMSSIKQMTLGMPCNIVSIVFWNSAGQRPHQRAIYVLIQLQMSVNSRELLELLFEW